LILSANPKGYLVKKVIRDKVSLLAHLSPLEKERASEPEVIQILESEGFKNIQRTPRHWVYDFEAIRDEEKAFIEVRTRSPSCKYQFFTFRDTKIKNLGSLTKHGKVFILLVNKYGYRLVTLEDLVSGHAPDVHFFKYKGRNAYYFSRGTGWRKLGEPKTRTLRIKCSKETQRRFKRFMIDSEAPNSEKALINLLDKAERLKELEPGRIAVEPAGKT